VKSRDVWDREPRHPRQRGGFWQSIPGFRKGGADAEREPR
jgi:hypothetical protein